MVDVLLAQFFQGLGNAGRFEARYIAGHPAFPTPDETNGRLFVDDRAADVRYYASNNIGFVLRRDLLLAAEIFVDVLTIVVGDETASVSVQFSVNELNTGRRRSLLKRLQPRGPN